MLIRLLCNVFMLVILNYISCSFLHFKYSKKFNVFISFIIIMIITIMDDNGLSQWRLIMMILLPFVFYLLMYKGDVFGFLLAIAPYPFIIYIMQMSSHRIIHMVSYRNSTLSDNEFLVYFCILVTILLISLLVSIYVRTSKLFLKMQVPRISWFIILLPMLSIWILFNVHETFYQLIKKDNTLLISIIILFVSNIIIIYLFYNVISSLQYKRELEQIKNREAARAQKYELIDNQYSNTFNFLHDSIHKCCLLKSALDQQNYDVVETELNALYDLTFREFNAVYSNLIILNYIIAEQIDYIKKHHITIRSVIEYNDFRFLSFDEQFILFSDLLEYTILEVMKNKNDRFILIKTWIHNQQVILQIVHSSTSDTLLPTHIQNSLNGILSKHNAIFSKKYEKENNITKLIIVFNDRCN